MPTCTITDIEPTDLSTVAVSRVRNGETSQCSDTVADECPVALVYNGISHAVMMATPTHLTQFAIGFSLSEGIVESRKQIFDVEVFHHADSCEVQLTIAQPAFLAMKQQKRALAGRTGCGVCGIESLALLDLIPEVVKVTNSVPVLTQDVIQQILAQLPQYQPLMQATGCAHAAAWCSHDGQIVQAFEDVGRHNALDKLIGWLAQSATSSDTGFVFLTSRASYELIRKAARLNIAQIATISAPTSLAISIAHQAGIRLYSFCRSNGFSAY